MKIFKDEEAFPLLPLEIIEIGDSENSLSEALQKIKDEFERHNGVKLLVCEAIYCGSDIRSLIYSHTGPHSWQVKDMTITVKFIDNGLTGFTDEEVTEILNKKKADKKAFLEQQSEKSIKNEEIKVSQCFREKIWNFIKKLVKL